MEPTIITARVSDQHLRLLNVPLIASGGVDVVKIRFEFCGLWTGCGKVAVFYRDPSTVFHVPISDNLATVPHEMLTDEGHFYFGVMGSATNIRTTEVVKVSVARGAVTSATTEPEDPTPDIYEQLLAAYGEREQELKDVEQELYEEMELTRTTLTEQNKRAALRFWVGTQAEYDALDPKPNNTFAIITDDDAADGVRAELTNLAAVDQELRGSLDQLGADLQSVTATASSNTSAIKTLDGYGYGKLATLVSEETEENLHAALDAIIEATNAGYTRQIRIIVEDAASLGVVSAWCATIYRRSPEHTLIVATNPAYKGVSIRKVKDTDGWSEWMWENPPMLNKVEYCTTEKWQGKSVYTMLVKSWISKTGSREAPDPYLIDVVPELLVRVSATYEENNTRNRVALPYYYIQDGEPHFFGVEVQANMSGIVIFANSKNVTLGGYLYTQIWYTKG